MYWPVVKFDICVLSKKDKIANFSKQGDPFLLRPSSLHPDALLIIFKHLILPHIVISTAFFKTTKAYFIHTLFGVVVHTI